MSETGWGDLLRTVSVAVCFPPRRWTSCSRTPGGSTLPAAARCQWAGPSTRRSWSRPASRSETCSGRWRYGIPCHSLQSIKNLSHTSKNTFSKAFILRSSKGIYLWPAYSIFLIRLYFSICLANNLSNISMHNIANISMHNLASISMYNIAYISMHNLASISMYNMAYISMHNLASISIYNMAYIS